MIRTAAVLGAGTMGSQIAAHLANAGVPALLLDLNPEAARDGIERMRRLRPDPFFTPDTHMRVTTDGFDAGLQRIADCDWIIEAVVEQLQAKQALLSRVETWRRPDAIVSSNTSGIPIAALAEGRSAAFRSHFLGTHFFNPPRYLRLLEVIPTRDTDARVVEIISSFADHRLGKGIVLAKDEPNFIGNRIGLYGMLRVLELFAAGRYTIEEIDAMTGPVMGRPKSATFRTMDIVGLDVLNEVTRNLASRLDDETDRRAFALPVIVEVLVRRGWLGEKSGQGFYRKSNGDILVLDTATLEYRPMQRVRLPELDTAQSIGDVGERIRTLFLGRDRVGEFMRETLGRTLVYTARVTPRIAHSIDDVDRATRWGFGWELGPFELWDVIGIPDILQACGVTEPPPLVKTLAERRRTRFRDGSLPTSGPDLLILRTAKERQRIVRSNPGASLVDLGDGVLALEFHSKMNTIGIDAVQMLQAGVSEAARGFAALVVGNDAPNFSVGANLMMLLLDVQDGNWDDVDLMVRGFQAATTGLRYSDVPVIAAPAGLSLGGGCEIAMHADRMQAAAETYIGLVETGVGLIPAGGGTKEMLLRGMQHLAAGSGVDPLPFVQRAFETIAYGRVSTSGHDGRRLGYLRDVDELTMNRERLMADAKARALERARAGYQRPAPPVAIPVGGESLLAPLKLGVHLAWRAGRISDHDAVVARKLAWVLAGGSLPHPTRVTEQYLLDLEREAFLSLCGEPKTQERIQYTLKTGKPLRN